MIKSIATLICLAALTATSVAGAAQKEVTPEDAPTIQKGTVNPKDFSKIKPSDKEYEPANPLYGIAVTGVELGTMDIVAENAYALGVLGYCKGEQYREAQRALKNQLNAFIDRSTELPSAKKHLQNVIKDVSGRVTAKEATKTRCNEYQKIAMEP